MSLSRRKTLSLIGGGVLLAASASGAGFLMTRTPHRALAPWADAGKSDDPRLHALSYAILAPNPHNRQPWEAGLSGADALTIWRDPARNLPHTDPFDRQMTIGMGCFLELLAIAASDTGHFADITLFPAGESGPVAQVTLRKGAARDPLFDHVLNRRSCKEPYALTRVEPAQAAQLARIGQVITDPAMVATLREITWQAWMVEAETATAWNESVDLMRFGKAEIEANPDGIDLGGPFLESLGLIGMMTRDAQRDPSSAAYKAAVDIYRTMLMATPAYATVITQGNSREDQIAAGRRWLRLNLTATALGLSVQPVSQALQEFPEMAGPYAAVHSVLAKPGETVQMLGRLGYGPTVPPTPRWPLETRLRHA
jgi:hypothetical protein